MTQPLLTHYDPETGVAQILFNRPKAMNALNLPMAQAFCAATDTLRRLEGLRCVVLRGEGAAFMAGGDVTAFATAPEGAEAVLVQLLNQMHPALLTLRKIDAPVIAAVNGTAAGAGFSLALAADYVVARDTARFVLAYDKLGAPPDCGGSWYLARKVGRSKAFELMLTGRILTAAEAQALGIVNLVSAADTFEADLERIVRQIASGPTRAFGMFKALMDVEQPLAAHLEAEREHFVAATRSEDFKAATHAFMEKRPASYRGR